MLLRLKSVFLLAIVLLLIATVSLPALAQQSYSRIVKQSATKPVYFLLVDTTSASTPVTGKTGSDITTKVTPEGGASATGAGTIAEVSSASQPGVYKYTPTTTETGTLGIVLYYFTCTGCVPINASQQIVAFDPDDAAGLGLSRVDTAISGVKTQTDKIGTNSGDSPNTVTAQGTISTNLNTTVSSRGTSTLTQAQVTGGNYSLQTDGSGYIKHSVGTGTGQLASVLGAVPVSDKTGFSLTGTQSFNNSGQTTKFAATLSSADVSGNVPALVNAYGSGQDPATSVLTATASTYNTAGTIGSKINAAGSAGDPLATLVPGSYTSGTAGYALGTYLNASVNGVKVVTDKLSTMLTASSGSLYTYTVDALKNAPSGGGGGGGGSSVVLVRGPLILKSSGRLSESGFTGDIIPMLIQFVDANGSPLAVAGATITATLSRNGTVITSGITPSATTTLGNLFEIDVTLPSTTGAVRLTVTRSVGSTDSQSASIDIAVKAR